MTNTKTISKAVLHAKGGMKVWYKETRVMDDEDLVPVVTPGQWIDAEPHKDLTVALRRLIPHYTHILGLTPDKVVVNGVYFDKYKSAMDTLMYRFKVKGVQVFEKDDERSAVVFGSICTPNNGEIDLATPKVNLDNGKYEFGGELKLAIEHYFDEVAKFYGGKITTQAQLQIEL